MITVFGGLCAAATTLTQMFFFRFLLGMGAGIGVPSVVTLLVESAPTAIRSQINNSTGLFFSMGEVYAAIGLILFLPNLKGPGWRYVYLWGVLPAILIFPFVVACLKESPRWLALKGRREDLMELLQYAAARNNKLNLDV